MSDHTHEESNEDRIDCVSLLKAIDLCKEKFQGIAEQGRLQKAAGAIYLISMRIEKDVEVDESLFQRQLNLILTNEQYSQFLETQHPSLMAKLQTLDIAFGIDAVDEMTNHYYGDDDYGFSR